ncbi:MAG: hypothetical protein AAF376_18480 [Pseudomonadota bacterium]
MGDLFLPPATLHSYLLNVVDGESMRHIARRLDTEPSTVSRRIRRCEDARDNPDFDAIFAALEAHALTFGEGQAPEPDRGFVLAALGLETVHFLLEFQRVHQYLNQPSVVLCMGDMPVAVILRDGAGGGPLATLDRSIGLAALAFGWLQAAGGTAAARKFQLTFAACSDPTLDVGDLSVARPTSSTCERLHQRCGGLVTRPHLDAARAYQRLFIARDGARSGDYDRVTATLPPILVKTLDQVCGQDQRIEDLESDLCIPGRSGKVLLVAALDAFIHLGGAE